jgi:serine/threonine protein kinase
MMSERNLQTDMVNGYRLKEVVGEGQYGQVIHCINSDGLHLAVKRIPLYKVQGDRHLHGLLDQETRVLLRVMHPNIIEFIESFTHAGHLWTVYEYCNKGSIKSVIANHQYMDEMNALSVVRSVLLALTALAQQGLAHRDIKPDNILIKEDTIKLADFGFCIEESNMKRGLVGSPAFMSPEAISDNIYTCKGDVYALGVTFYMMITGRLPFVERHLQDLYQRKITYDVRNDPAPLSPVCRELLARMFAPLEWRCSAAEAIAYLDSMAPHVQLYRPNFIKRAPIAEVFHQPGKRTTFRENPLQTKFMMPPGQNAYPTRVEQLKGEGGRKERAGSQSKDRHKYSERDTSRSREPLRSKSSKVINQRTPLMYVWPDSNTSAYQDPMTSQVYQENPNFMYQQPPKYYYPYYPPTN